MWQEAVSCSINEMDKSDFILFNSPQEATDWVDHQNRRIIAERKEIHAAVASITPGDGKLICATCLKIS